MFYLKGWYGVPQSIETFFDVISPFPLQGIVMSSLIAGIFVIIPALIIGLDVKIKIFLSLVLAHFNSFSEKSIAKPGLKGLKNMGNTCYMNSISRTNYEREISDEFSEVL